jgi:hypothetical protein
MLLTNRHIGMALVSAAILSAGALTAVADDGTPSGAVVAPSPDQLTLQMMDGSTISGKLAVKSLTVQTPYGTLEIPVEAIRGITPGLDAHADLSKQIADCIDKMGSDVYADRETAQNTLLKLGPSVRPEIVKARAAAEAERKTRLDALLAAFDDLADESTDDDAPPTPIWIHGDAVETTDFTIVGHIVQSSFDVQSRYGELTVKLADLQHAFRPAGAIEDMHKSVQVTGNDNLVIKTWEDSGVSVSKGDKVSVTADGKITLTPWGNNASSGPDGSMNYGQYQAGSDQVGTGGLIGKIGNGGVQFKVGAKHSFVADHNGKLMFAIAIQGDYGGNQFPGAYTVKIKVHKK